jgi:hypothetical protein
VYLERYEVTGRQIYARRNGGREPYKRVITFKTRKGYKRMKIYTRQNIEIYIDKYGTAHIGRIRLELDEIQKINHLAGKSGVMR